MGVACLKGSRQESFSFYEDFEGVEEVGVELLRSMLSAVLWPLHYIPNPLTQ